MQRTYCILKTGQNFICLKAKPNFAKKIKKKKSVPSGGVPHHPLLFLSAGTWPPVPRRCWWNPPVASRRTCKHRQMGQASVSQGNQRCSSQVCLTIMSASYWPGPAVPIPPTFSLFSCFCFLSIVLLILLHLFVETLTLCAVSTAVGLSAVGRQDVEVPVVDVGAEETGKTLFSSSVSK